MKLVEAKAQIKENDAIRYWQNKAHEKDSKYQD